MARNMQFRRSWGPFFFRCYSLNHDVQQNMSVWVTYRVRYHLQNLLKLLEAHSAYLGKVRVRGEEDILRLQVTVNNVLGEIYIKINIEIKRWIEDGWMVREIDR